MASPTVLIFSVSSSGISILNCSSSASTSSTTASESAFRSSENDASSLTLSGATSSCSMMIFLTFSSISSAMCLGPLLSSCYGLAARTLHEKATVDAQDLPGDVPGRRPGQKRDRRSDVLGFSNAAERNRLEQLGAPRLGQLRRGHVGVDVTGRNRVRGDAPRCVLARERLRQ